MIWKWGIGCKLSNKVQSIGVGRQRFANRVLDKVEGGRYR